MATDEPKAFFSYSRDDLEFALRLAKDLKKAGANVWMDKLDIRPGQLWERKVEEAVSTSPRMLVVLSPSSVKSPNVMAEVSFALDEQKEVIPVLYRDCKIPFRLRPFQYVDFRNDYSQGLEELLNTVGAGQMPERIAPLPSPRPTGSRSDVSDAADQTRLEEEREEEAERSRLEQEERELREQERKQAEEQTRLEPERKEAAEQARLEQERRQAAEQARLEQQERERLAAERAQLQEERRLAAAEKARLEHESRQAEEQVRLEEERQRLEQEDTRRAAASGSRFFSRLPVWGKVVIASCGILIVASVLYWSIEHEGRSQKQPGNTETSNARPVTPQPGNTETSNPRPVTPQSGWVVGPIGTILRTEDGGRSWEQQTSGTNQHLQSIIFVTSQSGWAVGWEGTIMHTEDGGRSWQKQTSGTHQWLYSIIFVTPQLGWTTGEEGTILHTEDGGRSWQKQTSGTRSSLNSIIFVAPQSGWAVGGDLIRGSTWHTEGTILHTEDGGRSWQKQTSGIHPLLGSIIFVTPQSGWAAGQEGTILHTEDGGRSWQKQTSGTDQNLTSILFVTPQSGWAVGNVGTILHTEDGGRSWQRQTSGSRSQLNSIIFVTS